MQPPELEKAREKLPERLSPEEAWTEMSDGDAKIIDLRLLEQRMPGGNVPGALIIGHNVVLWRCDPDGEFSDPRIVPGDYSQRLIFMCQEGYSSSIAALNVVEMLGMQNVTDIRGGFDAYRKAGLPILYPTLLQKVGSRLVYFAYNLNKPN